MNTAQRNWLAFLSPAFLAISPLIANMPDNPASKYWFLIAYTFISGGIGGLVAKWGNGAGKREEENRRAGAATGFREQ